MPVTECTQVVHSVHGIMFKDLKQILRKEQCDGSILLTANVPSTKKVVVHGPQGKTEFKIYKRARNWSTEPFRELVLQSFRH